MSLDFGALADGELAALTIAGRQAAFAEIMRRYREPIYRLVLGNIADPDEALDLVQETFVSAYRALRHYDSARPMRTWLARIALNKCRDWARRRRVRRLFAFASPLHEAARQVPDARPGHDVETADREELDRVAKAIAGLSASLREPLVLHTIEGLSQAETASILGITEKAVETRLRRARIKLSEQLGRS